VDFEKHPDWSDIFTRNLDPVRIIAELEILLGQRINPGQDLLFFDEIQAAPRAMMALRYFHEELPALHVMAAGSLLEFAMKDISFPVGRVEMMNMSPMNFYEFLRATGNESAAITILSEPAELSNATHNLLLQLVKEYMFVGGMPECVATWAETRSMAQVFDVQDSLLATFREDFGSYAPHTDKRGLQKALKTIAGNIGHQVLYSRLTDEFTGPTNKKAFELLCMAKLITRIPAASPASLPLSSSASDKKFKAIMLDIGLMRAMHELPVQHEYTRHDLLSMYQGAMAEQFVGQEILSHGNGSLHYWSRDAKSSSAEVDYMLNINNNIVPVEVKGGASGKLKSLHLLLKEQAHIRQAYVLSGASFGHLPEQRITVLPLYYAFRLLKV
jgi:hypothetical protein